MTRSARARGWQDGKATSFTAYDAKAEALALLAAAGAPVDKLQVMGDAGDAWQPGQSGTLRLGPKTVLAAFGMVHPSVLKAFDLDGQVVEHQTYHQMIRKDLSPVVHYAAARFPVADTMLTQFFHSRSIVATPTAVMSSSPRSASTARTSAS